MMDSDSSNIFCASPRRPRQNTHSATRSARPLVGALAARLRLRPGRGGERGRPSVMAGVASLVVLAWLRGQAFGQTPVTCAPADPVGNAALLCSGNPCVISRSYDVADGCVFDFGTRLVRVEGGTVSVGSGQMRFEAGSFEVSSTGKLKARGDTSVPAGGIDIVAAGAVSVSGLVDVNGNPGGDVSITAAGDVTIAGSVLADGLGLDADGGSIDVQGSGSVAVSGTVSAVGSSASSGGSVLLSAGHNLTVTKAIDVSGGLGDAGDIDMEAGDDILVGKPLFANGTENAGSGGQIDIAAGQDYLIGNVSDGGNLTVQDRLVALGDAFGSGENADCGDGGFVSLAAQGDINVASGVDIKANGAPPFCGGGTIVIDSTDLFWDRVTPLDGSVVLSSTGSIEAKGGGIEGYGGDVEIYAGVDASVSKVLDVSGSESGGELLVEAARHATINKNVLGDAGSIFGSGGTLEITAGNTEQGTLTVSAGTIVSADGGPMDADTMGGDIALGGCDVFIGGGVQIRAQGADPNGGAIEIAAARTLDIGGASKFAANSSGSIALVHRPGNPPLIGSGVVFDPAPFVEETGVLGRFPFCPFCGNARVDAGEQCDDGNATSGDCCAADCTAEDLDPQGACHTGRPGVCDAGTLQCVSGALRCVPDGSAEPEVCDGLDNNCDGQVDEGNPGGGGECDTGQAGVCATGVRECEGGTLVCVASDSPGAEVCDGLDNDCDGQVDEVCPTPAPTPTPTPTGTAAATPTATASPTPSPLPTPVGGVSGNQAAVAKCGKAIGKAASTLVKDRQKALAKCVTEAFKCVQLESGAEVPVCLAKAAKKCEKGLRSVRDQFEPKFAQAVRKACPLQRKGRIMVPVADLESPLGFADCIGAAAPGVAALEAVIGCVKTEANCRSDEMFGTEAPRTAELLLLLAANDPELAPLVIGTGGTLAGDLPLVCLPAAQGAGGSLGEPRGRGKAALNCQKTLIKAAGKFALKRLDALRKCHEATLPCALEPDPGRRASCWDKASQKCDRALAPLGEERLKLWEAVLKQCGAPVLLAGDLEAGAGLDFADAEIGLCPGVGVGALGGAADVAECLVRQHECASEDVAREASPRLDELLAAVGQAIPSTFCP